MEQVTTSARLTGVDAAQVLAHVGAELAAHDLPVETAGPSRLCCNVGIGWLRLRADGSEVQVELEAGGCSDLFMLRESVHARLDSLSPGLSNSLRWSGAPVDGPHPPNFRRATVTRKQRIAPRFMRLRLSAPDLAPFACSGLHIRLLIPPAGREPVWPTLDARGRARWPDGADRLHCPAYTIRRIDPEAGHLDVDVYMHGHGPTCSWAEQVATGAPVGISGPGGGWYPQGRKLILAGDETALPAIARILEDASEETAGQILISVGERSDMIALRHPSDVAVRWLIRDEGAPDLNTALEALSLPQDDDRFIWFAAETLQARRARHYLREDCRLQRHQMQVTAYWSNLVT